MKYMGSKNRIAKHILPIMLEYRGSRPWVEPFVGGGNMIDKVKGDRIGYDLNPNAIDALILIRDSLHLIPKNNQEFTEADFKNKSADRPWLTGFASFAYAFGGDGGWARGKNAKGVPRDFVAESYRNALKQSPFLQGVFLQQKSYKEIELSEPSLLYCDPPYKGTSKYKTGNFNHDAFWSWCNFMANNGHIVFVSEYSAPSWAKVLWEKEVSSGLKRSTKEHKKRTEKLFLVEPSS